MKLSSRANIVSSFTIIKGTMIEETYAVFAAWDFTRTKRENLDRLRSENFIGASSTTWLRDVANEMDVEDGVIWVYGVAEDGIMAFTDFGIENLIELVRVNKSRPEQLRR